MYQFIATIFAATIAFSTFSAVSANTPENNNDESTSRSAQSAEQNKRTDR